MKPLRIEKAEYITKTFRLDASVVREMEEICQSKNISLNKLTQVFLKFALENLEE